MRRTHSRELKLQVVRELVSRERRISQVCREHSLCESVVRRWMEQYRTHGEEAFLESTSSPVMSSARLAEDPVLLQSRIRELEASLGRAHLENEFLRGALKKLEKGGSVSPGAVSPGTVSPGTVSSGAIPPVLVSQRRSP